MLGFAERCSGRDALDTIAAASDARGIAGSAEPVEPRSKVWLERGGKVVLSEWRVELLAAIGETGSLAQAAEKLEVPYRTAWYKLKEAEERLGVKLVDTQSGGAEGGGSQLTPAARQLIERFRRVAGGVAALVDERFRAEFADLLG